MPTTVQIEDELAKILDEIMTKTPRYRSRSDLVRQILWDFAYSFDEALEAKFGKG